MKNPVSLKSLSGRRPGRLVAFSVVFIVALAGILTLLFSKAAITSPTLYLSPATQSVASGSDVVVSVTIDTVGASVNTVQTVVTYDPAKFSFVSMSPGASFGAAFPNSTSPGSIVFSAGSTTGVSGVQTVASITLHATGSGTAPISLAAVCPAGNFSSTCSAAYNSVTSSNDLVAVSSGSYTVNPVLPTVPANLRSTATTTVSISLAWDASTDLGGPGLAGYNLYRNGSIVNTAVLSGTSYIDAGLIAGTTYSYQLEAVDTAGNKSAKTNPLSVATQGTPPPPPATTLTFLPAADTWISQKFPKKIYGTTSQLKGDSSPNQDILVKFTVSGVGTKLVKSAKLQLYVNDASDRGGEVFRLLDNSWNETTVSWDTSAPASDTVILASLGAVSRGSTVEFDLSSVITADGTYGFKINAPSSNGVGYNSKEAASNKPRLVLTLQ